MNSYQSKFASNCRFCGGQLMHSKLRGYHCRNEQHNERESDLTMRIFNAYSSGKMSPQEWDLWLNEDELPDFIQLTDV